MTSHLIPTRQGRPGNDPIFALSQAAAAAKARGEQVINATLGALHDDAGKLATLPTVLRALRELGEGELAAYAPISGTPAFLDAVKRDLLAGTPLLDKAIAAATPGGTGALRHAITTFLEEGGKLVTTSYFWGPYATLATEHNRGVRPFSMFADGALDVAALDRTVGEAIAAEGRALVVLNDPCHNPTGYSMSDGDWAGVARVLAGHAEKAPVTVVLDSAYAAFSPGAIERPIRALGALAGKVLIAFCWSASKTFLAYGQRVGALVVVADDPAERADIDAALTFSSRGTWSNCNHAGMAAVTRILTTPELAAATARERKACTELLDERVHAWNEAARPRGLKYPRYDGGFFVTVETVDPQGKAAALRERGIYVVPIANGLRVALCSVATADVPRLAATMAEVVVG